MKNKNLILTFAATVFTLLNIQGWSANYSNPTDTIKFFKSINVNRANKLNQENTGNQQFIVIDVRATSDYKNDHLANAISIDFKSDDFIEKLKQLDRDKTYMVYCYGGVRSKKTMEQMEKLHFTKVYNVKGGMMKWKAKGLPVVKE
mgnify:CR=1 FL=1